MRLESKRLIYEKIQQTSFAEYASWYMNENVMRYITGRALNLEETKLRFSKVLQTNKKFPELGLYLVRDKEHQQFIGIAKLVYEEEGEAEVGYGMLPEFWGKGYASEILERMIDYSKTYLDVKTLTALVNPENSASVRVLKKFDFFFDKASNDENNTHCYRLSLQPERRI